MGGLVDRLTEQGWKLEIKTGVVMNEDSVFRAYVVQGVMPGLKEYYVKILDLIEHPYDIADATPLASKPKELNPDIVVSVPCFHDGVLLVKTIKALGLHPMFVAGVSACGYTDPESIDAIGEVVEWYTNTYTYKPYSSTKRASRNAPYRNSTTDNDITNEVIYRRVFPTHQTL